MMGIWRTLAGRALAVLLAAVGACDLAMTQSAPGKVFLVRHAEPGPGDDPALSAAGRKRAAELSAALRGAGITAILTSPLRRTRETAAPLAAALGLSPTPIDMARGIDAHIDELANAVRGHSGGAMLVVGHSNTVPRLIGLLGGPTF
jgi:phosphohistidine phosphatase SixA